MILTEARSLTPAEDGLKMDAATFFTCVDPEGWRSELIEGKIVMSPLPMRGHEWFVIWFDRLFMEYSIAHPELVAAVSGAAIVMVDPEETYPQPDLALYHEHPGPDVPWEEVSPFLVVEVLSESNARKDTERTVEFYRRVSSILEYWIVDPEPSYEEPTFTIYRRADSHTWAEPLRVLPGETYITPTLPGFTFRNRR